MKKFLHVRYPLLTLVLAALAVIQANGQMKIGSHPTKINKSSILELESDRQGLLLPRLTSFSDINAIIGTEDKTQLNGMMVYYTGNETGYDGPGLYCYEQIGTTGTYNWVKIASASDAANNWSLQGNANTTGSDFLGTTDANPLVIKTNNNPVLTVTASGKLQAAASTITTSAADNELNVLVLGSDGTINMRTLPADIFKNVVTGITDGTTNLTNTNVIFKANAADTYNEFQVVNDGASNTANINAPIMDKTSAGNNVPYGFMTLADWQKLNNMAGINSLTIGQLILSAANDPEKVNGAKITNDGSGNYTIQLVEADATHNGVMTTNAQTFAGDKTFNGNVSAASQLAVDGTASLNGGATVGTSTTNADLTVNGNTTMTGNAIVNGNTTLGSNTSGTVTINNLQPYSLPAGATTVPTLVVDATNQVHTLNLSTDALKNLQLGNTAGSDPSNGSSQGLNIDNSGTNLVLNVPDAANAVRGVVSTGTQTFGGDKTFAGNTTISNGTTAADFTVANGTTSLNGTTTVGSSATPANLTVNGSVALATASISSSTALTGASAKVHTILVNATSGDITITLPTGSDLVDGMVYTIKIIANPSLNNVDILGPNEDGGTNIVFYNAGSSRTVQYKASTGTWYIIAQ